MDRIDQDIHFTAWGVPVHMRLDTGAPDNRFLLKPEREEDKQGKFAKAIRKVISPHFAEGSVSVFDDHATIIDSYESTIQEAIALSLPEWDGQSLEGLQEEGAEDLANFLLYIADITVTHLFRSNGSRIELDVLAR